MQKLNFNNYKIKQVKATAYEWQNRVLEVLEYLDCPPNKKSSVFRAFKRDRVKAESVIRYMQERGIKSVNYFFKCV